LIDRFLFANAEKITLVLREDEPLNGSDLSTRQTMTDISAVVRRLREFFGNRFVIEKWLLGKPHQTRSLLLYWNRPTDLTRLGIIEGRASFDQRMQVDVERWTRESNVKAVPEIQITERCACRTVLTHE
ncbi:hypothetical protein EDB81DRAFT_646369, partial [Dactylonectria macrodidyma]